LTRRAASGKPPKNVGPLDADMTHILVHETDALEERRSCRLNTRDRLG
jgi:hypothetical protein